MRWSIAVAVAGVLGWSGAAGAQAQSAPFPPESAWAPFQCGDAVMTDGLADEPGAAGELDLVGDSDQPAGLHAADADYFYVRLRLDADPVSSDVLLPSGWGMEFDLDGDLDAYEVLILADGIDSDGQVSLFENSETAIANDPTDPADVPPVATYDFADAGRSVNAGLGFGNDGDRYLDLAVPWDDLSAVGLGPDTPIYAWAASSTSQGLLDGDFACHDGGSGDAGLDEAASVRTTADPNFDPGDGSGDGSGDGAGDGSGDGSGSGSGPRLEGGGGCAAARAGADGWLAALLAFVATMARVRRGASRGRVARACRRRGSLARHASTF